MMDILSPERKAALIDAMERYSTGSAYMVAGGQDPIPFALQLTADRRQFVEGAEQSLRDVRRRLLPTREELIAAKATMDPEVWARMWEDLDMLEQADGVSAVSDTTRGAKAPASRPLAGSYLEPTTLQYPPPDPFAVRNPVLRALYSDKKTARVVRKRKQKAVREKLKTEHRPPDKEKR